MNTHASQPLLVVDDLHTEFETARGVLRAVDGVSFELDRGRTLGIVGESGSGKTVLARSIMGILPSSAKVTGDMRFEGRDLTRLSRAEARHFWGVEVAMVFQDPMTSLNPTKKVGEHIAESLRYHLDLDRKAAREQAVRLLQRVGIPAAGDRFNAYPHQLSGGMRQRVVIAMALACEPKLLFADEPTTALDVTVQKQILDLLSSLRREREMAMILITHDLGVVAGRTDDIAVMYAGRLVETAPTGTLFKEMRHPYTEALLFSIPKTGDPSHTRLNAIPGRPPDLINPPSGCVFAPRCRYAQPRCLEEVPPLADPPDHQWACFYPVGTDEGALALETNRRNRVTAAGMPIAEDATPDLAVALEGAEH